MTQPEENGRETEIWSAQETSRPNVDRLRSGQPEDFGSGQRAVDVGVRGADREGSPITTIGSLNGGILRRLKEAEQRRLAEARECVEWYERQQEDALKALAEIEALERLEQSQRESRNGH